MCSGKVESAIALLTDILVSGNKFYDITTLTGNFDYIMSVNLQP